MPSLIQSAFLGGEWAPEFAGRTDLAGYKEALAKAQNVVILPQGGATMRPGQRLVAAAKNGADQKVRLERWGPGNDISYVLEFGPTYIRFFRNRLPVLLAGVPFEVTTPYAAGDLDALSFTRLPGQLYIWSAANPPALLSWTEGAGEDTSFALSVPQFVDGPYLDPVGSSTTITPGAAGAATATLTASAVDGINGGAGYRADDVGRSVRFNQLTLQLQYAAGSAGGTGYVVGDVLTFVGGTFTRAAKSSVTAIGGGGAVTSTVQTDAGQYLIGPAGTLGVTGGHGSGFTQNVTFPVNSETADSLWSWGLITAWHSAVSVDVALQTMRLDAIDPPTTAQGVFITTNPLTLWRLGAWCPYEGYPQTGGSVFQGRLMAASTAKAPKRVWAGETKSPQNAYIGMAPTLATGQVIDTNAAIFDIEDDGADTIRWLNTAGNAQTPQIGLGSGDAEFSMQSTPAAGAALQATNVQVYKETQYTSAPIAPVRIGKALLFVEGSRQRLRRWVYRIMVGGLIAPEPSPFGRHLMLKGIKKIDYALAPHQIVWQVTEDGRLLGLTYLFDDPSSDIGIAAWHQHPIGGRYYGGPPIVESLAVSPAADRSYSELWLSVIRADAGGVTKTIEVSTQYYRTMPLDQAVFVDSAISSTLTYPAATCSPVGGPFVPSGNEELPARGDEVAFEFDVDVASAGDLVPGTVLRINNGTFRLSGVTNPTLALATCMDVPDNLAPQPAAGWSYTAMQSSFSGFDLHDGRIVAIIGDGALYPPQLVSGGTLTLDPPASYVTAGYGYTGEIETLDLDLPTPDGTSQGKTGRLDHLYLRMMESIGIEYGPTGGRLDLLDPRSADDLLGWAPLPFSGDRRVAFPGGSSAHRKVTIRQANPWPMTVLALVVKGGTMEQAPR